VRVGLWVGQITPRQWPTNRPKDKSPREQMEMSRSMTNGNKRRKTHKFEDLSSQGLGDDSEGNEEKIYGTIARKQTVQV